jgi:signal transduction histidine kinase
VRESAEQLLTLIDHLLDLSKIEAGRMEVHPLSFAIPRFIITCCETVAPLVKSGVQLRHEIIGELDESYTDEEGLRQIVLNLLSNAIKFTEVGEIVVRARCEERANDDPWLKISVIDTGAGIAAESLDRIFDEFEQIPKDGQPQKGTGLGLPIAKRWASLLGGALTVQSELKKGSTFTVSVPLRYR